MKYPRQSNVAIKSARLLLNILVLLICGFSSVSVHATVAGIARVIDGDTIDVDGQVIRLHGIDAPENAQRCTTRTGKSYACGLSAQNYLHSLLSSGVICTGTQYDAYDRLIGSCHSKGVDVNRQMVLTGHAVAFRKYSMDYVNEEKDASSAQRGLWSGTFQMPSEFREKKWNTASQQSPLVDCPIKGNINRKGERIYHVPWSRSYARTRINTEKSERWFCSEAQAIAAGWRAPRR